MYIEWKHEKTVRDSRLHTLTAIYWSINKRTLYRRPPLPVRPVNKSLFHPIGEFDQHPNSTSRL